MKNILKVVFVIIGTLIGAGFASGQEIYLFFYRFGANGLLGIIVFVSLTVFAIYKVLKIIYENQIRNQNVFVKEQWNGRFRKNVSCWT